eukprot:TRINITY_DN11378_c0_g1_i1.p1 TRINITY_DN11378_c0_g1~~TRINITY_DN11378_c0_g1_i1.p1  ORF type:complete len:103 (+),score=8.15 TRINITY_DN11378_c0_g1_i1:426-734(+)
MTRSSIRYYANKEAYDQGLVVDTKETPGKCKRGKAKVKELPERWPETLNMCCLVCGECYQTGSGSHSCYQAHLCNTFVPSDYLSLLSDLTPSTWVNRTNISC